MTTPNPEPTAEQVEVAKELYRIVTGRDSYYDDVARAEKSEAAFKDLDSVYRSTLADLEEKKKLLESKGPPYNMWSDILDSHDLEKKEAQDALTSCQERLALAERVLNALVAWLSGVEPKLYPGKVRAFDDAVKFLSDAARAQEK